METKKVISRSLKLTPFIRMIVFLVFNMLPSFRMKKTPFPEDYPLRPLKVKIHISICMRPPWTLTKLPRSQNSQVSQNLRLKFNY